MRNLPTQLIRENGATIEFFSFGSGQKTIVFINGFRMPLSNWSSVIDKLAAQGASLKLTSYNRPGIGKSSKPTSQQDGHTVIQQMHHTLRAMGVTTPVTLVAHSLGGIFANLFARQYPELTEGVIFVDAPHPDEILQHKKQPIPFLLNAINNGVKHIEKLFSPYRFSEDEEIFTTINQLSEAKPFPKIPVAVITGCKKMPFAPQNAMQLHLKFQKKLLELSPLARHISALASGHFPQIDEPELVANTIRDMVAYNSHS